MNKYFQIPSNISNPLAKTKTSEPGNINMEDIEKLIQQNQNQQQVNLGNIASVAPTKENDDLNKYFKSMTLANQNPIDAQIISIIIYHNNKKPKLLPQLKLLKLKI